MNICRIRRASLAGYRARASFTAQTTTRSHGGLVSRTRVLLALAVVACLAIVAGCGGANQITPLAPQPNAPTRAPQPTAPPTAAQAQRPDGLTLIWWAPEFLSPQAPQPVGPLLAKQISEFTEASAGKVRVEVVRKARYGKGGLLDSLRTAQPVARDTLPDIIALDVAEVGKAVDVGLLQPLNALLDTSVTEKLYPFASEAGQFNQRLYAVQYLADVDHASYLPAQVAEPPGTWADLVARRSAYLFPLAPPQLISSQGAGARPAEGLSHAVLGQYLSTGATLGPDRRLIIEQGPLLRLLTFYADASKTGVLPPAAQDLPDGDAVWAIFAQGQAPLAYVSARRYIGRGDLPAEYAAPLGYQGPAPSLASGWVLAIVTPDAQKQRAAADLITWLLKAENAGPWAARAGWLPTSSEALRALGTGRYWSFLDAQLAQARALPAGADYGTIASRIQAAIVAVVRDQSDPAAATEAAISSQP